MPARYWLDLLQSVAYVSVRSNQNAIYMKGKVEESVPLRSIGKFPTEGKQIRIIYTSSNTIACTGVQFNNGIIRDKTAKTRVTWLADWLAELQPSVSQMHHSI